MLQFRYSKITSSSQEGTVIAFTYHTFEPLTLSAFQAHYPQYSREDAEELHDYWLKHFHFNAMRFYRAQYEQYINMLWREFSMLNGLSDEDANDGWNDDWERFQENSDLSRYHLLTEQRVDQAVTAQQEIYKERLGIDKSSVPIGKMADVYIRLMELRAPPDHEVDAVWFNWVINTPPKIQRRLRDMPYPQYLASDHWRKVRAAMLLINKAVCQANDCWYSGESWYGGNWEMEIHVHHLSYKNRGNERYKDLTLLCRAHHERWHAHELDPQEPAVKIAFRD